MQAPLAASSSPLVLRHPSLAFSLLQYTPSLGMAVLKRVGPARAQALKEGRSGYDTTAIIKSASTASLRE